MKNPYQSSSYLSVALKGTSVAAVGDVPDNILPYDLHFPPPPWVQPIGESTVEDVPQNAHLPVKSDSRRRRRRKCRSGCKKDRRIKEPEVNNTSSSPEKSPRKRLVFTEKSLKHKWICCRKCHLGIVNLAANISILYGIAFNGVDDLHDLLELAQEDLIFHNIHIEDEEYVVQFDEYHSRVSSVRCRCGVHLGYLYRGPPYGQPPLLKVATIRVHSLTPVAGQGAAPIRCIIEGDSIHFQDFPDNW